MSRRDSFIFTLLSLILKSVIYLQGLDLRVEHSHCFSLHGEGGHYHEDVTPETVEYVGYFTPALKMHRIDRPLQTHNIGRD